MKQVLQHARSGEITVEEVPAPQLLPGCVLVQVAASVVSAGTERASAEFARKNLLQKAKSRPDLVRDVIHKVQRDGLLSAVQAVRTRLDQPQTPVRFPFGGTYDATGQSCNVWCHFNRTPGPVWTNDTGSARQCGSCHDFPPKVTRAGDPHPSVPGELSACQRCHPFGPSTHVNGVVDFVQ